MAVQIIEMGECVIHGLVPVWRYTWNARPEFTSGPCCLPCMIEYLAEHLNKVTNPRLIQFGE
jgi:hypothetical protein